MNLLSPGLDLFPVQWVANSWTACTEVINFQHLSILAVLDHVVEDYDYEDEDDDNGDDGDNDNKDGYDNQYDDNDDDGDDEDEEKFTPEQC